MLKNDQVLKVTLEINQDNNLDELMAHLCLNAEKCSCFG